MHSIILIPITQGPIFIISGSGTIRNVIVLIIKRIGIKARQRIEELEEEITTLMSLAANNDRTFHEFMDAQVRMFKVGIYAWVMELLFTIAFKIFFGIFGAIDFLQPACVFAVQCYFLGFAILDNYHEQFELSIKESSRYALNYVGVAAAAGLVAYLMMLVPVAGVIAAPIITSVAVSLIMYELSDLHILGRGVLEQPEEVV